MPPEIGEFILGFDDGTAVAAWELSARKVLQDGIARRRDFRGPTASATCSGGLI
jgi:hypothetical protein